MDGAPVARVIMAIDPASTSGWALFVNGELVNYGTTTTPIERHRAARMACKAAQDNDAPLAWVFEKWATQGKWSARTLFGMGASRGRWLEATEVVSAATMADRLCADMRFDLLTMTWHTLLHRGRNLPSDQWKKLAGQWVVDKWKVTGATEDEADAICMGHFAMVRPEVVEFFEREAKRKAKRMKT